MESVVKGRIFAAAALAAFTVGSAFGQQDASPPAAEAVHREGTANGGVREDAARGSARDAADQGGAYDASPGVNRGDRRPEGADAPVVKEKDFRDIGRDGANPDAGVAGPAGIRPKGVPAFGSPPGGPIPSLRSGAGTAAPPNGALDHGIDLRTPDGGYSGNASLRRRAERRSLVNSAKIIPAPMKNPAHSPFIQGGIITRDATGVLVAPKKPLLSSPGTIALPSRGTGIGGVTAVGRVPVHPGPYDPPRPLTGIGGAAYGRVAAGSAIIGGPAKNRSGINGTAIQPKIR
jgi:hypothetical protein